MIKDENGYIIIKNVRSKFGVENPYQRENLKQLVHNIDTSIEFLDVENSRTVPADYKFYMEIKQ